MEDSELRANVLNGIDYLDVEVDNWWRKVNTNMLNMCDPALHVLAVARGILVYETSEFMFWSHAELVACGFMPLRGRQTFLQMDAIWRAEITRLQMERA